MVIFASCLRFLDSVKPFVCSHACFSMKRYLSMRSHTLVEPIHTLLNNTVAVVAIRYPWHLFWPTQFLLVMVKASGFLSLESGMRA